MSAPNSPSKQNSFVIENDAASTMNLPVASADAQRNDGDLPEGSERLHRDGAGDAEALPATALSAARREDTRIPIPARVASDRVIAKLRDAEKALQDATTLQDVKLIADVAHAQEVFAHRHKLSKDVGDYAHEIEWTAKAKLGAILRARPKATGGEHGGRRRIDGSRVEPANPTATYAELGLDKKTASQAQQMAALPAPVRQAIAKNETTLAKARRDQQRNRTTPVELPTGRYRVLYADPPWHYGNSGVINDTDGYGHAARHYASMPITELCALDVKSIVADDAVLFMWVTSPLLAECWPVIKAWGFTYKTSIIWDKVAHNYGYYVSVRHELLLICTRGSCLPDHPAPMPDSVMTILRSEVHSEKPEDFRELIDRLYDGGAGQKLELFGRHPVAGWTQFGNELTKAAS